MGIPAPRRAADPKSSRHRTVSAPKTPFARRPPFPSRVRCAAEFQGTARSVRRVDGPYAVAAVIGARIGLAGIVIGIFHTIEKPPRSGGLTLLIACEGAVAEARILVALNAKRIAGANSRSWRGADHG